MLVVSHFKCLEGDNDQSDWHMSLVSLCNKRGEVRVEVCSATRETHKERLVFVPLACPSFEAYLEIWTDCLA